MAESSWPTVAGGRSIDDVQWEQMCSGFMADGVIGSSTDTPVVYADSSGMQVKVRPDKLGLVRGHGWSSGPDEFTRSVSANSSGSTRVDLAVLRLTRSTGVVSLVIVTGTPGAGVPNVTQDAAAAGAGVWEIPVAQITVIDGATSIATDKCVSTARYVGANPRPAWLRHQDGILTASDRSGPTSLAMPRSWGNTSAPTADGPNPSPPYYNGSELNVGKVSGSSRLLCTVSMTGFSMNPGSSVTIGVRIGGVNYPVARHYFNLPMKVNTAQPTYTRTGPNVGGQNVDGDTMPSSSTGSDYTGVDFPYLWAPGNHAHPSAPHYHALTVSATHLPIWGFNAVGDDLAPGNHKAWLYVVSSGTLYMDDADSLYLKFEEIDT